MRSSYVLVALLVACKSKQAEPKEEKKEPPPVVAAADAAPAPDAPAAVAANGDPLPDGDFPGCPDGAERKLASSSADATQWCVKGGKKEGPYVQFYGASKRKSFESYVDDQLNGPQIWWDAEGRVTTRFVWDHGKQLSPAVWYKDGKKTAEKTWGETGMKLSVTFNEDGSVATTSALDCPAGTTKKVEDNVDLSDKEVSREHRTRITCLKGGKPNGPYVILYPGGELETKGTYVNGVTDGPEMWFHDTGGKFLVGQVTKGKQTGTWEHWKKNKSSETDYDKSGKLIADRFFSDDGKLEGGNYYDAKGNRDHWTGDTPPPRKK